MSAQRPFRNFEQHRKQSMDYDLEIDRLDDLEEFLHPCLCNTNGRSVSGRFRGANKDRFDGNSCESGDQQSQENLKNNGMDPNRRRPIENDDQDDIYDLTLPDNSIQEEMDSNWERWTAPVNVPALALRQDQNSLMGQLNAHVL